MSTVPTSPRVIRGPRLAPARRAGNVERRGFVTRLRCECGVPSCRKTFPAVAESFRGTASASSSSPSTSARSSTRPTRPCHGRQSLRPVLRRRDGPECRPLPGAGRATVAARGRPRRHAGEHGRLTVSARRMRRPLLGGLIGAGLAVAALVVGAVLLATGRADPAKTPERATARSTCAEALLRDWQTDASTPATGSSVTGQPSSRSRWIFGSDSQAPEDISQALSQRIVQGRKKAG